MASLIKNKKEPCSYIIVILWIHDQVFTIKKAQVHSNIVINQ